MSVWTATAGAATTVGVRERSKPRASKWPLLVVGLIALNMMIVAITVVKATGDESMATEPGYYEKAMRFSAIAAERDASKALGWRATVEVDASSSPAVLRMTLRDASGLPVQGCVVQAEAFANTRASKRRRVELSESGVIGGLPGVRGAQGMYEGTLDVDRAGLWTVRVRATRLEETFVHETEVLVSASE
jgi:nitrogen fixation protein FixH